jgi:beta-galactosidase
MNRDPIFKQFTLGAQLERRPAPELKRDMQLLKKNGFNQVSLQVDWAAAEPLEGQFDFAVSEELLQHAAGLEMGVVIAINCAQAPGWLNEKYPDRAGFDHPGGMSEHLSFIRALVERLGRFENIVAWNTWQEHTERFISDTVQLTGMLRARAEAVKAADPLRRPVIAQTDSLSLARGSVWAIARAQDFLAASCFPAQAPFHAWDDASPKRGQPPERAATLLNEIAGVAHNFDHLRSHGAPVWAAGFQGGPLSTSLYIGRTPSRDDMRRWILSAAASGVTAISFTRLPGMLTDNSAESNPRLQEAARVGAALNRYADLFGAASSSEAEVGILVDEENAQFCAASPPDDDLEAHLAYSMRGWHRLLWELGIPVDFVNIKDVSGEMNPAYKALILPFPLSLSEESAEKLGAYVYTGGALISEAAPGRFDQHGTMRRGELSAVMSNLFGVRQTGFSMIREPGETQRWMPQERGWGEFLEAGALDGAGPLDGQSVPANLYVQTFECQGSQPVLKYNSRAAGTFRVGVRGMAWLIGTCVGHSALAHRGPQTPAFVRQLLELCRVKPVHAGSLLLRKRAAAGKQAWFLTNPSDEPVTETIDVGEAHVEDLLGEPLERSGSRVKLTVAGLDVRVIILTDR